MHREAGSFKIKRPTLVMFASVAGSLYHDVPDLFSVELSLEGYTHESKSA
jgi:hypothetical protein